MKLIPSSIVRRNTAFASAGSAGCPQIPAPVIRMAPNPRRLTVRSPPTSIVPAIAACTDSRSGMRSRLLDLRLRDCSCRTGLEEARTSGGSPAPKYLFCPPRPASTTSVRRRRVCSAQPTTYLRRGSNPLACYPELLEALHGCHELNPWDPRHADAANAWVRAGFHGRRQRDR